MRVIIGLSMIAVAIFITIAVAYLFFKGFNKLDEGWENELQRKTTN